jgi:hypothetical protein
MSVHYCWHITSVHYCWHITSVHYCWYIASVHYCYTASTLPLIRYTRDAQVFQKSESQITVLGARKVKWSQSHPQDQQIWSNLVAPATWRPGFVHSHITLSVHYCQVCVVNRWKMITPASRQRAQLLSRVHPKYNFRKYFWNRLMFDDVSFGSGINECSLLCKTRGKN